MTGSFTRSRSDQFDRASYNRIVRIRSDILWCVGPAPCPEFPCNLPHAVPGKRKLVVIDVLEVGIVGPVQGCREIRDVQVFGDFDERYKDLVEMVGLAPPQSR